MFDRNCLRARAYLGVLLLLLSTALIGGQPGKLWAEPAAPAAHTVPEFPAQWIQAEANARQKLAAAERKADQRGILLASLDLGDVLVQEGRWAEAIPPLVDIRKAPTELLAKNTPLHVSATAVLAVAFYGHGDLDQARALSQEIVPLVVSLGRQRDATPVALRLGMMLADDESPAGSQDSLASLTVQRARAARGLARVRFHQGRLEDAEQLLQQSLDAMIEVGTPRQDQVQERLLSGQIATATGEFAAAEHDLRDAIDIAARLPPSLRESEIDCWQALGELFATEQNGSRALEAYTTALAARLKRSGPDHWQSARLQSTLGGLLVNLKDYSAAVAPLQASWAWFQRRLGPEDVDTARSGYYLGQAYYVLQRTDEAEPLFAEATKVVRTHLELTDLAAAPLQLGEIRADQHKMAEAEGLFSLAWTMLEHTPDPDSRYVRTALMLGRLRYDAGNIDGAEPVLLHAYEHRTKGMQADRALIAYLLARIQLQRHQLSKLGPYQDELVRMCNGTGDRQTAQICAAIAENNSASGTQPRAHGQP
jgi:tetratricopeptide (TPR) repeat protein